MCLAFAWREWGKPRKHLRITNVWTDIWNLDILYTELYLHLTTTICRSASNNVLRVAPYGRACIVTHHCDTSMWHTIVTHHWHIIVTHHCDTQLWNIIVTHHWHTIVTHHCDTPLWHIIVTYHCDTSLWHTIVTHQYSSSDLQRQSSFLSMPLVAFCTMGTGCFPGVNSSRGVMLTPHPLLVPLVMKG